MNPNLKAKIFLAIMAVLLISAIVDIFDRKLAVGILFIAILTGITFLIFKIIGFKAKTIFTLFLIALLIHLGVAILFYYTQFQPFSGGAGDYTEYSSVAQEISGRIHQGNFSLQGLDVGHYYPVILGYVYALTLPEVLIAQMFNAWLIALLVIVTYFIVLEIGVSEKGAFLVGLIITIYPSLLFFGGLPLKEALANLLCVAVLLSILKVLKAFSWGKFLIFYAVLAASIHFRSYVGFALILTFIISWFLFSNLKIKKRLVYGVIFVFFLGFIPSISGGEVAGTGYYGINFMRSFLNSKTIAYYREFLAIPNPTVSQITGSPVVEEPSVLEPSAPGPTVADLSAPNPSVSEPQASVGEPPIKRGRGSAVMVETGFDNPLTFLKNSFISFIYASLGPFPWQLRYLRHLFILPELILWYLSLFFVIKGMIKHIKSRYRVVLPLVIFSLITFGALSLYICDFGITTRIRIPAFLALFCLTPLGINWASNNRVIKTLSKGLDVLMGS